MLKRLSNQNLGKLCISFVVLFLLSGCGEHHCIKPENLSGLREKLDIVSTEQKWVDSGVNISDRIRVTEIDIVSSKVNFCPKQYADFAIGPGRNDVTLPFALKAGDFISFSVIGSKVCQDKEDDTKIRYVKIDEKCSEEETEHFAHVLNQNECQAIWQNGEYKYTICPNKYIVGNPQWLNGKEYWPSKLDQDKREKIKNVINSIKQEGGNIDCRGLSSDQKSKIDTHILNLLCRRICKFHPGSRINNCVHVEYNTIEDELFASITNASTDSSGKSVNTEIIGNVLKNAEVKTDVPLLNVYMDNENFEHIPGGGLCTNCDHEIKNSHAINSELTFTLGDDTGKGGFNIRVIKNHSLGNSLYISVSDKFPEHKPGENQGDISVDISKVHDIQYMESIKEKLKDKTGTIYYGIRDHGCDYKNEGQFSISLTTKEPPTRTFSAIYNFFDEKVKTAFFGSSYKDPNAIHSDTSPVKSLYESFIKSSRTNTIRSTIISLQMFHNWVKNLARFAIHPVVLLIFISLISQVMDYIIYSVFDFEVCTTCILGINLKIFQPCIIYAYASKYTPNITAMMAFVILGHAMKALIKASSGISDSLFGVYVQNEPGKQYQQSLLGTVGLDKQSVQRRAGSASQQSGASRPQIPQRAQGPQGPKIPGGS
ncbi:uncharacterized protein TNIN_56011 [Trichonephila inaurata madagascariensis]|uniref:Uncharacterized protein n=1 Tax=Trichonephila inaurata madagascariensis TaxID=2747483 RepID=A0A8X6YZQ2_9ARAC|nr:uncharacterized protein TNIN_56011 [Trichonephila inaurata madagascariensis]